MFHKTRPKGNIAKRYYNVVLGRFVYWAVVNNNYIIVTGIQRGYCENISDECTCKLRRLNQPPGVLLINSNR